MVGIAVTRVGGNVRPTREGAGGGKALNASTHAQGGRAAGRGRSRYVPNPPQCRPLCAQDRMHPARPLPRSLTASLAHRPLTLSAPAPAQVAWLQPRRRRSLRSTASSAQTRAHPGHPSCRSTHLPCASQFLEQARHGRAPRDPQVSTLDRPADPQAAVCAAGS